MDKERKNIIVFDDMIADMINNEKLNSIVTELFIRGRGCKRFYTKFNSLFYHENSK